MDPPITGQELHQATNNIMRLLIADYGGRRLTWEELTPNHRAVFDRLAEYLNQRCNQAARRRQSPALPELAQEVFSERY